MIPLTQKEIKSTFLRGNTKLHEIQDNNLSLGDFHTVNEDEEIWIMQCPKGAQMVQLQDHKIKLPGRSTIKDELETIAVEYPRPVSHAFGIKNKKGHNSVKILPIKGSIVLRSRLRASTLKDVSASETTTTKVPMPSGLKERHPLHGVDYESKIKICPNIVERLKQADEISASKSKKKSKNKSKKQTTIPVDSDGDVELVTEKKAKKKKKKRKHSTGDEDDDSSKKRKKKSSQSDDVSEDLQWIKML